MARSMYSMAVIEQFEGKIGREPLMYMVADRSNEKFSRHLSQCSVELYGLPWFSAMREASLLYTVFAMEPIPPAAEKTSGEKEPCSTSRTRSSYALFFPNSLF